MEKHGSYKTAVVNVDIESGEILKNIENYNFIKNSKTRDYYGTGSGRNKKTTITIYKLYRKCDCKQGRLYRID